MTINQNKAFNLTGRVALITGASGGIGAEIARGFAEAGASVVLAARRMDRLEILAAELSAYGSKVLPIFLDITDRSSICAAFTHAQEALGVIDIVVNNAGVAEPSLFLKTKPDSLASIMAINFTGAWDVTSEAAKRLIEAKHTGSIINIASVLGIGSGPGYAAYSASKGALIQLTRSLALEFIRHGIRVNALAPGWFITEMNEVYFNSKAGIEYLKKIPPGRAGLLKELVGPALLLASDAGSYVNGVVLPVDGGHHVALV